MKRNLLTNLDKPGPASAKVGAGRLSWMRFVMVVVFVGLGLVANSQIFSVSGGGSLPSGWISENNVTTNAIDQTTYYLLDAGNPSDRIITINYDLSASTSVVLNVRVATYGSGTAYPLKIEFSVDGGATWSAISYTTATPSSSTYIDGGPITISQTFSTTTKFRFSNNGTSGRGVRIQNLILTDASCTPPTVTSSASPATICSGSSSTLTASGADTYSWNPGSLTGASVSVSPTATTTYTVTGSASGCTATSTVTVTVNTATITASASPASICSGNSSSLTAAGGTSYVWSTTETANPITVSPAVTATYTVTGSAANTCTGTATVSVTVNSVPSAPTAGTNTPSQTQIVWDWTDVAGATGYQWNTTNTYPGAGVNTVASSTYTQTGLTCATAYTLYVWTYNSCSNSAAPVTLTQSTSACGATGCAADLFISEYIEGSSNNKAIEIYNGTGSLVDLSNYTVYMYANGSPTPSNTLAMSGTLADGDVYVIANSSANATILGIADITAGVALFNGDDAIAIWNEISSTYSDVFGRIGEDPGSEWTSGSYSTADKTLVRNATITSGVTSNPASGFPTLATEWTLFNIDDISHLGSHTMTCSSNTITTGTVSAPPFTVTCSTGASGTVAFTSTDVFNAGNVYTAQLSNASGSFASPVSIGTLTSTANSGTINITIPPATASGAGYKIRVVSSNPIVTGTESAVFTVTLTGGPCSCIEIESILVDACDGSAEGRNEMFRFIVGGNPINTADITVTWPNVANTWQGICQNATTASIISNINATITAGGQILEPVAGMIPAGAQVMFFTNTNFNYAMFDFSDLNYTLYAIFQCPDNLPGHFVNHNSTNPTNRTLTMNVGSCGSDAVTYNAYYVYNGDGATVDFDYPGNPTYSPSGQCSSVPIFSLPVSLLYLKAVCENDNIQIHWSTATEINNAYFTIEAADVANGDFVPVVKVDGAGNSNEVIHYSADVKTSARYFRLKQTDFDGRFTYSDVIAVDCEDNQVQVFPTLASEGDQINIIGEISSVRVFDSMSREINPEILDNKVCCLEPGMYFFVINQKWTYKVVVQ